MVRLTDERRLALANSFIDFMYLFIDVRMFKKVEKTQKEDNKHAHIHIVRADVSLTHFTLLISFCIS